VRAYAGSIGAQKVSLTATAVSSFACAISTPASATPVGRHSNRRSLKNKNRKTLNVRANR
jgi:hypothetical protein